MTDREMIEKLTSHVSAVHITKLTLLPYLSGAFKLMVERSAKASEDMIAAANEHLGVEK